MGVVTPDSAPEVPRFHNRYYEIPRNPSSAFTEQHNVYTRLREACLPSDDPSSPPRQRRFVLHGLGGSGKTQLCLKFAEEHRERCVSRARGMMSVWNQGPTRLQVLGHLLDRR